MTQHTPRICPINAARGLAPVCVDARVNLTLSGLQTVSTVALNAGDRVLVSGQTNTAENGIYIVGVGAWQRTQDFNTPEEMIDGRLVRVEKGPFPGLYRWSIDSLSSNGEWLRQTDGDGALSDFYDTFTI